MLERDAQPLHFQKSLECLPLLLETQRETLKNLIECVHLEKPVLLCGSTDTGKTKIIDTLCCISNQMCNLDNIDDSITGSFQQIDLNRHLEKISFKVECIYLQLIQNTILNNSSTTKMITDLLDSWNTYSILRNSKCDLQNKSFVSDQLMNYRKRIDKLNNVIDVVEEGMTSMANEKYLKDLSNLRNMLNMLQVYAKRTDSLNTGGCFEWVNSKIVESLKEGQYILLEYVNLCSSAVLDRLNPVFEPNGTLMLSEKGVTGNEKAETVEKATNFRAFLTFDPKNGELSRAMRNRCVEIFVNDQPPSLDDKRALVFQQGVHDINAISCLISIHDSIAKLTEINNLTVSHLTQAAFLCASYKRIGYQMKRSIYVSAMEVYVYSASTDLMGYGLSFYQNKLREIVITESEKFVCLKDFSLQDRLKTVVLQCSSLTEITLVNLQLVPLKIVLDNMLEPHQVQKKLSLLFSKFSNLNMEEINFEEFTKYLIYIIYEISSLEDLGFRYLQLKKYLKNQPESMELSKTLYNCIAYFDNHSVLPSLPWNTKIYPRIREYKLETLENHGFCLSSLLIVNMLIDQIPQEPVGKMSTIDALTYSQSVAKQEINDNLNNIFLRKFSFFLHLLEKVLKGKLDQAQFDITSYTQLMTSLQWFNRILNISKMKLYQNKDINTDLLDKLILHFKWLDKYLISLVRKMLPNIEVIAPGLHDCHQQLSEYILSIKLPLNFFRKMYAKHLIEFQPFSQEHQVKVFKKIQEVDQILSITPLCDNEKVAKKVGIQKSESARRAYAIISKKFTNIDFKKINEFILNRERGKFIPEDLKCKLQNLLSCLREHDFENHQLSSEDVDIIEDELNNIVASSQQLKNKSFSRPCQIQLNALSIRKYFLLKYIIAVVENSNLNDVDINYEYQEEIPFLNSTAASLLNTCKLAYYQKYSHFWFDFSDFMNGLQTSNEFEELILYLNGGYKHLSALSRLIQNSVQRLQLENSYADYVQIHACEDIIENQKTYKGSPFTSMMFSLLFDSKNNTFKAVPLSDLDVWKSALDQLSQIVWHNSILVTPTYSVQLNNYVQTLRNAKRLQKEVKYIEMICEKAANENSTKCTQVFGALISKLNDIMEEFEEHVVEKYDAAGNQMLLYRTSFMSSLIGCIELCLMPYTPLIDPVEKSRMKDEYMVDDIYCLTNFKFAYQFARISMKYKHLGQEVYEALEANISELKKRQRRLKEKVAVRPEKYLYSKLVRDITHFLNTNCNPQALVKLITNIESKWNTLSASVNCGRSSESAESSAEIINKLNLWITNSQHFVYHTLKPYSAYYQDFLQPLQCSIDQLRFGFEGVKRILTQLNGNVPNEVNANKKLHTVLQNIAEFPTSNMLNVFDIHSSRDVEQNRCSVFSLLRKMPTCESDYFHLLKSKIIEIKNRAGISRFINKELFVEFDFAFNIINQVWQKEEEMRRKKQDEDESLYLTKTKCRDADEEMEELDEIDKVFPTTIHEDFGEFIQEDALESVIKLNKQNKPKTKKDSNVIQEADYAFIGINFIEIMVRNSQTYYHRITKHSHCLEFVDSFKERFKIFFKIYNECRSSINDWLDEESFNSLCFCISIQKDMLEENMTGLKQGKTYNFYKDSNIQEVAACVNVLNTIEQRVTKQLELYPEHATLIDINKIIERIRLLPSTGPVVRFNTGFQLLRQNIALWNEVAHKNNNLKDEEEEIAQLVQKWTRLELQFWRNCLSHTYEKVENTAYKYWFFIYNLVHEFIVGREIDSTLANIDHTVKRFAEHEVLDQTAANTQRFAVEVKDVINILRQFVESSCYGDFSVRLQLLLAFELYLHNYINYADNGVITDTTNKRICELISGLRNLQLYFDQFSKEIEEHKIFIKAPIEKKLKELVKIESYNKDLSYISMRNNVARVHRNLNKFLKEYEQLLKEKITAVFQPKDSTAKDYNFANDKGKDLRYDSKMKYYMVDVRYFVLPSKRKVNHIEMVTPISDEQTLVSKVERLFTTSRKVVKETVTNAQYPKLIIALDTLLSEQLERCEYLRNLTVDRSKERPKQKLEAKQILQQKRKALTDLFKTLTTLGVNYKTGLMELSMGKEFEDIFLPPFCIKTMLSNSKEKRLQLKLLQLNENLDRYFNKSVFKLKLLRNIMLTPLSELGLPNIERIKGFAVDLFLIVQKQRKLLALTTKNVYDYGVMLQHLNELEDMNSKCQLLDESHTNFKRFQDQCVALKAVLTRIRFVFEQLKLFILHVPRGGRKENILFADANSENDQMYNKVVTSSLLSDCENVLTLTTSTIDNLTSDSSEFMSKDRINQYFGSYNKLYSSIKDILKVLKTSNNEYLPIAKPLLDLSTYINDIITEAFKDQATSDANSYCNLESVDAELENIIHAVLLSLQKLYKKYREKVESDEEEKLHIKRKASDNESEELDDQHLKKKLYCALKDDWSIMAMENINEKFRNILRAIKLSAASENKISCIKKLLTVQPLLEQFNLMAEYFLCQQLGAHKVSVKMLSITLTVFAEIGTKGFCVPQDLMQDEIESKKDQQDGKSFGLEDGTGEKDASDKIESEDQLDDAKRPEDRKEENDKDEPNECKEEKGIEMSDNFDGEMQDIEKQNEEEDDSGESENEEDMSKEMGETDEGADKLDDQIWGDDDVPEEDEGEMDKEEDGKGNGNEQDAHNNLNCKNETSKDDDDTDKDGLDATNAPNEQDKSRTQDKDIDDMVDEEGDQDQVNPHHNELDDPELPEDFDLGDLNVNDENEEDDKQQSNENPFDIDTMKENMQDVDETFDNENNEDLEKETDENKESISDDDTDSNDENENGEKKNDNDAPEEKNELDKEENQQHFDDVEEQKREQYDENSMEEENKNEKHEQYDQSKDKPMKEDNMQSVPEIELTGSIDQLEAEKNDKDIQQDQSMDKQDTGEDEEGVGQAENETNDGGHQGIAETNETVVQEDSKIDANTKEKRKQGQTDDDRTVGKAEENKIKRLKTIDKLYDGDDNTQNKEDEEKLNNDMEAEEYHHVKEPKSSDKLTLDNATEEQSKNIQPLSNEEKENNSDNEELDETQTDLNEEIIDEHNNIEDPQKILSEKMEKETDIPSKSDPRTENIGSQEQFEVEGEIIETMTVSRSDDTTAHCNKESLADQSGQVEDLSTAKTLELRKIYQNQITSQHSIVVHNEDQETWQTISNRMAQNARDLCEQLRLILEPTKCTRLKGDYRSGRRINMKKIIPYIASQFRKDKIWLRRTKPAQRDYKVTIAIDDSKSMHHNNSKVLTLEAISLVSQALTLLESGRLSVLSFGEQPQILLNHNDQFDGPKLVSSLQFSQDKTKIAELLDFIGTINNEEGSLGSDNNIFENLLLILSDGRNIFSEGKSKVKNSIKIARLQRIFLVYIIIDNPENKNSILDIQTMEMLPNNAINIKSYLEDFPFPYYVIVRDLNQLPTVLSEAMRQWFELVNSEQ